MSRVPQPNQGTTSGPDYEIECPTCGATNDITGDPVSAGDEQVCVHCDAAFWITAVDYDVTVYTTNRRPAP